MVPVYVVRYETRDPLGRIVDEIDSIFLHRSSAVARRKTINGDPETYPDMVADVIQYVLRDFDLTGPPRHRKRIGNPQKLTAEKVIEMRQRYAAGDVMRVLADAYGVSVQTVSDVIHRRMWPHV
jgi:hypothetical protein